MRDSKDNLPLDLDLPGASFCRRDYGDMAVAQVKLAAGVDATPLLEGLPQDRCQVPHWGYMLDGSIQVSYTDGTKEVCRAGDVFFWPAGHTVRVEEDATFVEFSPKGPIDDLYAHIRRKTAKL